MEPLVRNISMQNCGALTIPQLLWYSCDAMMVIDERRRILAMNPALEAMTGRRAEETIGKSECGILFSCRNLQGCPLSEQPWECPGLKAMTEFRPIPHAEYTIRDGRGKGIVVDASYTPIQLLARPVWALVVMRNRSDQKRRELQLIQQAKTDPLTALPNRTALLEGIDHELARAGRHQRLFAFALLDLDHFKNYNDTCGHPAGDDLLRTVGQIFRAGRRLSDLVCRYGGDEFGILLPETDAAGAMVVTERHCRAVAQFPFPRTGMADSPAPITLSAGVSLFPQDGKSRPELIKRSDERLYQAKAQGGDRVAGPP